MLRVCVCVCVSDTLNLMLSNGIYHSISLLSSSSSSPPPPHLVSLVHTHIYSLNYCELVNYVDSGKSSQFAIYVLLQASERADDPSRTDECAIYGTFSNSLGLCGVCVCVCVSDVQHQFVGLFSSCFCFICSALFPLSLNTMSD